MVVLIFLILGFI